VNVLPLASPFATLENAGGKGANLARLTRAGFPVPDGFLIPTDAYRQFVHDNGLNATITAALDGLDPTDPIALDIASAHIRAAFTARPLPETLAAEIQTSYEELNQKSKSEDRIPVAVRSSATAEDLPDLSFAGQQDTYLNIVGGEALREAVIACWGSLWTARAIGYRARNGIPQTQVALAVVVQQMVQSEASGVLFTANPLTGHRGETAIDATLGLGEALVSGLVEPDHYLVANEGRILEKNLGAKATVITSRPGGGTDTDHPAAANIQAIPDDVILALTQLGQRVAAEYDFPQDIEWAWVSSPPLPAGEGPGGRGEIFLLQSRPITSLFPLPQLSFDPLIIWFSFASVQGVMGPITPLGQDAIQHVIGGAGKMFGLKRKPEEVHIFEVGGERIWVKISDVIRNPMGNRVIHGFLGFIDPSAAQIVRSLEDNPHLGAGKGTVKLNTLLRVARFALPVLARFVRNMLRPEVGRAHFDEAIESYLATAHLPSNPDPYARLAQVTGFMRDRIANAFPFLLPQFIPLFGPSMAGLNVLSHLSGNPSLALEVTRGLPRNVTTEMDLSLWETAKAIRADTDANTLFQTTSPPDLARQYLDATLPPAAQTALGHFLDRYGMRGVGEIDFGQPRWRENPTPVIHTLQSYLQIASEAAPDVLFAKGEQAALDAVEQIATQVRQQPRGWVKEKIVRAFARRIRVLMGSRESPKFFAIRTMGIARRALLEIGQELVKAEMIDQPDDLVFLHLNELENLAKSGGSYTENTEGTDVTEGNLRKSVSVPSATSVYKTLITERRAVYMREERRKQIPRILVSDGRAFYEGVGAQTDSGNTITGSPVSPGVVEGIVHVVFDPRTTQLAPGEILVCPGTDPAWTPLFLSAGGLVMEVGGMMTHGSVVAREYGIPAVVGVHKATSRLESGQRIRVDGSTGQIVVLE